MKYFILKENNENTVRKELMDELISKGIYTLEDTSWMKNSVMLEEYHYRTKHLYNNVVTILRYMINTYPQYDYIYNAFMDYSASSYNLEELLLDSIQYDFENKISNPYFLDDEIEDSVEDLPIKIKDIFNKEKLDNLKIINEDTKELITKEEAEYIASELEDRKVYNDTTDEIYEYVNYGSNENNEIFHSQSYTVFQFINFDTFEELFSEAFPELSIKKNKSLIKSLKGKNISPRKEYNLTSNINNNSIKKIVTGLYSKNKDLDKVYSIKELNSLSKKSNMLKSGMDNKINGKTIVELFPNGFSINKLLELDSTLEKESISDISIFKMLKNSDLEIGFSKWNAIVQRFFLDKPNYVFQLNLKNEKYQEILDYVMDINDDQYIYENIKKYIKTSMHPISRSKLTLAWIRFTKINDNEIVMDEIQTDLDNPSEGIDTFNDPNLLDGWEDIILSKFIKFVRYNLNIRNIYYPTVTTKKDKYKAKAPTYLYSELPKKYGFSSQSSNLEGFMLLEKKIKRV